MGWHPIVYQSCFSKEEITEIRLNTAQREVIAFYYANSQAIAPPPNSVKPASILTNGLIGIIAVITKANVNIPDISSFVSHSINSGIIGLRISFVFSSLSIALLIEPITIEPKNKPSTTNIIIAPIFLKMSPFLLCKKHKDLLCPSRAVQNQYLPKAEIQDKSQTVELLLLSLSENDSIFHHQPLYDSFKVKKKHINTIPQAYLNAIPQHTKNAVHNVFSNYSNDVKILYCFNKGKGHITFITITVFSLDNFDYNQYLKTYRGDTFLKIDFFIVSTDFYCKVPPLRLKKVLYNLSVANLVCKI